SELAQHGTQRPAVLGLRHRCVVLVHVRVADLPGVGVRGLEKALGQPPAPEREQQRANQRPPTHTEQGRLPGTEPRRADEHQSTHPLGVYDRDLRGDRSAHRVPDEHGIAEMQRVEQGHGETGVGGIGIARVGLVGESEAAVIEGNQDRKSTRLNSSHLGISYAVFCLKKKKKKNTTTKNNIQKNKYITQKKS